MGTKVVTKAQDSSKISVLPFGCLRILNHISRELAKDEGREATKSHIALISWWTYGIVVLAVFRNRNFYSEGCQMTRQIVLLILATVCLTLNSAVLATDRLVPSQYPTIQAGINAAQPGDTVIVAQGTYTGAGNKDLDFGGKAITVQSTDPEDPNVVAATVINCQGSQSDPHRGFYFHSGEEANSVVSGLSIINGYVFNANGGGICCIGSSPTIEKCVITGNQVQGSDGRPYENGGSVYGGGVYCSSSNAVIIECRISNNKAFGGHGGMAMLGGHACGGGIYGSTNSYLKIDHCTITGNISDAGDGGEGFTLGYSGAGHGGGIYGKVAVTNTVVMDNGVASFLDSYGGYGAGGYFLQNSSVINCLIAGNWACCENSSGGGIYGIDITVISCTICNNTTILSTGGIYCHGAVEIMNCIIRSNDLDEIKGSPTVTYSNVEGDWSGEGNIDADPCFVSGPEGDYYLSQIAAGQAVDSSCVDAGSDTAANLGMDIYTTRTDEVGDTGIVDMGYHYHSPVIIEYGNPDIDGDGDVDFMDYSWLSMGLFYETSKQIPMGSVVVDGDLGDWPGSVDWRELDKVYWSNPNDVTEARFALQWDANTNKVYAAVIVNDADHVFLDEYVTWDASDRLEVYSQGDAEGGSGWIGTYDVAQQYYVAPDTSDGNWATCALGEMIDEDVGLEYAVGVDGTEIIYEVGVRMFDNYGGFSGGETLLTELHVGHVVGFDIVACTRSDTNEFGMLSENLMMGKFNDAGKFGKYILVDEFFSTDLDGNGENNYADLGILFESWLWGK
jgi:hypothetical protein